MIPAACTKKMSLNKKMSLKKKISFILISLTITVFANTHTVHKFLGGILRNIGVPVNDINGNLNILGLIIHTLLLFIFLTYILRLHST